MARSASKAPLVQAVPVAPDFDARAGDKCKLADGRIAEVAKVIEPQPIQVKALLRKEFEVLFGGAKGGGKLSPLESKVLTPLGWRRFGDLKVGDAVSNPTNGGTSRVIGVYPQGTMPIYRVAFDDDTSLEVGMDHLWAYRVSRRRRPNTKKSIQREYAKKELGRVPLRSKWAYYRVGKTSDLVQALQDGLGPRIPLTEPVLFTVNGRTGKGKMPPYLAGLFLGDGCNTNLTITSCDDEIRDYLVGLGFTADSPLHTDGKPKQWRPAGPFRRVVDQWLRNHNLRDKHSWDKFIPSYVFTSSLEYRVEFLRGLMDTDGTVDERGRCSFTSVSKELAQGVRELVWSLGGKASLKSRESSYTKNGEKIECRVAYTVRAWLPKNSVLFNLSRKKARCTDSWNGGYELSREVISIEYVGEKEAQCIAVDNPFGLYIADDYVVTHNTACGRLWLLGMTDDPSKFYIHNKHYKALVLRRNQIDLGDWVDQAKELYSLWGAEYKDRPYPHFLFPSGAKLVLGHLADEDAYEKWQGQEFQRMLIEELTQIPTFRLYWLTVGNCRSPYPELKPQVFLTTNPIGPGTGWVRERFIDVLDKHGRPIPPESTIEEEFKMPDGRTITRTRVYVPARLTDNKYLMDDPGYMAQLMGLPPNERKAMLDGDWRAMSGVFFETFRPRGPLTGEPPEASHVVEPQSVALKPWWHRWAALDWGFSHNTVILWACHEPEGRVYVTREMVTSRTSPEEVGAEFARRSIEDLAGLPQKSLTLWLPHDAFGQRTDDKTIADQIQAGIIKTLGPNSCYVADVDKLPNLDFLERLDETREMSIIIRRTVPNRVAGWQFINQMLRWWPIHPPSSVEFERDYAMRLLYENGTPDAYLRYMESLKKSGQPTEVLPMLRIFSSCPQLIKSIQSVVHDPKKPEDILKVDGDDPADTLSYLCQAFRHESNRQPFEEFLNKRLQKIASRGGSVDGASQFWIAQKAEYDWRKENASSGALWVPRASMGRRSH